MGSSRNDVQQLVSAFVAGANANTSIAVVTKSAVWTISDGSTDFRVGDKFTFNITKDPPAASTPAAGAANIGNGTCSAPTIVGDCPEETITCTCITAATNGGTFKVEGSKSGKQATNLTVGSAYTLTYQTIAEGDRFVTALYFLTGGGTVTDKRDKMIVYSAGNVRCSDSTSSGSLFLQWIDRNGG